MTVRLIRPEVNLDCKIQVPRTCFADPLAGGLVSGSVNAARVPTVPNSGMRTLRKSGLPKSSHGHNNIVWGLNDSPIDRHQDWFYLWSEMAHPRPTLR